MASAKAISHCGTGCILGDIAGKPLHADFLLDFIVWLPGIGFQHFTIAPMRDIGPRRALGAEVKADTFSIISFQTGLFAGMRLYQEAFSHRACPGRPPRTGCSRASPRPSASPPPGRLTAGWSGWTGRRRCSPAAGSRTRPCHWPDCADRGILHHATECVGTLPPAAQGSRR
ncbi:DUF4396 domain-containing protein [Streptomyces sp. NPDC088357]|uniref:DUF4396 domain-containing protein n=1 Tax=Streptomyces sp. NPDC088357 TaxID=3154655 RepID=UPI003436A4C8